MLNHNLFDLDQFSQQLTRTRNRVFQLLTRASLSQSNSLELLPGAFKELGVVSEELEVTFEELRQQNEQLEIALEQVTTLQNRYRELFDFAPEAYLITDANGCIQEANQSAMTLLGVSAHLLVGKPLVLFVHASDRQLFRIRLLQLQQTQTPQEWDFRLRTRDQQDLQVHCWINPIQPLGAAAGLRWRLSAVAEGVPTYSRIQESSTPLSCTRDLSNYPLYSYDRGDLISLEPQIMWLAVNGAVKLTTLTENNEEILVGLAGPDTLFSMHLTALPLYQAIALSKTQLRAIPLADIENSPSLLGGLTPQMQRRLRQTEALLAITGQRRVMDRLWMFLEFMTQEMGEVREEGGIRLTVRLTHEDLASACCTTRVTVTRMLGQLQQQGKLMTDGAGHLILLSKRLS